MKFEFDDEQWKKIQAWELNHVCPYPKGGTIGDRIYYRFLPTSLGMASGAHCACGSKINVTDYDKW